jgi:hypothetical protein
MGEALSGVHRVLRCASFQWYSALRAAMPPDADALRPSAQAVATVRGPYLVAVSDQMYGMAAHPLLSTFT